MSKNQKGGKTAIDLKSIKALFVWAIKNFPHDDRSTIHKIVVGEADDQSKTLWDIRRRIEERIIATHPRGRWFSAAVKEVFA